MSINSYNILFSTYLKRYSFTGKVTGRIDTDIQNRIRNIACSFICCTVGTHILQVSVLNFLLFLIFKIA